MSIDKDNVLGVNIGNEYGYNVGSCGLYYENELNNVLGIHIKADSVDGLALDRDGYVVMTGFIALPDRPSDWSTSSQNYYHLTQEALDYRRLTPEQVWYKKMHRTANDFVAYSSGGPQPFGGIYIKLFDRVNGSLNN